MHRVSLSSSSSSSSSSPSRGTCARGTCARGTRKRRKETRRPRSPTMAAEPTKESKQLKVEEGAGKPAQGAPAQGAPGQGQLWAPGRWSRQAWLEWAAELKADGYGGYSKADWETWLQQHEEAHASVQRLRTTTSKAAPPTPAVQRLRTTTSKAAPPTPAQSSAAGSSGDMQPAQGQPAQGNKVAIALPGKNAKERSRVRGLLRAQMS